MPKQRETHQQVLRRIARRAMRERGLEPDYSPEALAELAELGSVDAPGESDLRDLRQLLWASIDNDDSRDLDQLTAAEELPDGRTRIFVAIADVDALVTKGTAIDDHARHNTTSVYTPAQIFAMLPERLSTDLTSLNDQQDRPAIVVAMVVDERGVVGESDVFPADVRNHAQLAYNRMAEWFEGRAQPPAAVTAVPGLTENLLLQDRAAQRLKSVRHEHGALDLQTLSARPLFAEENLLGLELDEKNRAKGLIEDFMIAANGVIARFLRAHDIPSLRRVVRRPSRWERIVELAADLGASLPGRPDARALTAFLEMQRVKDPLRFPDLSLTIVKLLGSGEYVLELPGDSPVGHFGLAVRNYAHSTAPNRRFPDLITQRLVKATLRGAAPPYDERELQQLARHCTQKEDDADKVERLVHKSAAALLLESRIGDRFDAVVTGAGQKGTWVRILDPHVEGMLVSGARGLDVGDRLRVELVRTDVERGYIDFRRVRR